jgi:pimeloyl-ACP methyl ester carboxylesterase
MSTTPGERRLETADFSLRVREEGKGPAVVLVHGWALDLEQFESLAELLRRSFRVLRFDRPGFGASTGVPSTENDLRAIGAVLAYAGGRGAIVAASQGGRAALRYALANSAAVAALVVDGVPLEGSVPGPRAEDVAPLAELAVLLRSGGLDAVRRALVEHPFFRLHGADAGSQARLHAMLERYPAADIAALAAATEPGVPTGRAAEPAPTPIDADPPNVAARLHELTMPVLVLNGEHDTAHRRLCGDALAYALPRAQRAIVRGAGHLVGLDRPDEYAALIAGFLYTHLQPTTPETLP